jgi:hypothetical protein
MGMTTREALLQYIAADLAARAEAANIDLMDEWDFPSGPCEDAPCCGCCGTNLYGTNNDDYDGPDESDFDGYNDEFEYGM